MKRYCKPTDGVYEELNNECRNCSLKSRRVCQLFATYKGRKTKSEIYSDNLFVKRRIKK